MAGTDRKARHHLADLIARLSEKPYRYGFFSVLRLIECLYKDNPRLGTSHRPMDDPVRIGQAPATTFEPASLTAFEPAVGEKPHRLTVRCLGLLGPNGPLPLHLTEYAKQRMENHKDATFVRFLDIFHHRMMTLFYRAWANNEPAISFDRPHEDRFGDYVGAVAGLGMSALRRRDVISDLTKLHYAGRFSSQTRCAEGLQDILIDYFQLPIRLESFVGGWLALPGRNICRLGRDPVNGTLGESAMLGSRVWACQHKFRLVAGPLGLNDYERLLPVGDRIRRLMTLVRNYIGDELVWDLKLILKRQEVPAADLSGHFRLGWTTWLGVKTDLTDADDLIINVSALISTMQSSEDFR